MKKIWVVHPIELHLLYIKQVFSQLSIFLFRKKSSYMEKMHLFQYSLPKQSESFPRSLSKPKLLNKCLHISIINQSKDFEKTV